MLKEYYVHKHSVSLAYGGPEEGGWWFKSGIPTGFVLGPLPEFAAYDQSLSLNQLELARREAEEDYDFTSVLAHMGNHYEYRVEDFPQPEAYPQVRPHYE